MAAKTRLKEDEGQKVNYRDRSNSEIRESLDVKASANVCQLRSILKRKDIGTGSKPQKRVRFDCAYKDDLEEQFEESEDSDDVSLPAEHARPLPDYLRNPSRYTCYSFCSSSEVGEESNAQTWEDVLKLDTSSKSTESLSEHDDAPHDLPKSGEFYPKEKIRQSSTRKRYQ
ncbi:uncharacterized protein LOC120215211 [Hibiscus syriacus]|uniref:uncharacterized protein LOC120215211 n=1 Tax=Hibiscus syriacus TaxID=106335 RepID=UPI001923F835|nr:uncharacterized protein LOC120215211 [Hibiscus syriacus]